MRIRCNALQCMLAVAISMAVGEAGLASEPAQLFGAKSAQFSWDPAPGAVAGYYVIVSRNGSGLELVGVTTDTMATVGGKYGDSIVLHVAAFDGMGTAGPLSPPSQTVVFSPPAGAYSNGGGSNTSDPSATSDPVPSSPAPLDFTGDGVPDLLVRNAETGAVALWQLSNSLVTSVVELPTVSPDWEVAGNGDYDGNGVTDVLWQHRESGALEIWNMAGGAVAATSNYDLGGLESEGHWIAVGSGDFDGDSRDEIVLLNRVVGVIEIVRQDASGAVALGTRFEAYEGAWNISATPDVDGDGVAEIIWVDGLENRAVVWRISGTEVAEATLLSESLEGRRVAGFGDHNGDGKDDLLIIATASSDAEIWLMSGTTVAGSMAVPSGAAGASALVSGGGDYDYDGRDDLLSFDASTGTISIWTATTSEFASQPVAGGELSVGSALAIRRASDDTEYRRKLCSADMDGDGFVGVPDFSAFGVCYEQLASGSCEIADLDSDGYVGSTDYALMSKYFGGPECANGY